MTNEPLLDDDDAAILDAVWDSINGTSPATMAANGGFWRPLTAIEQRVDMAGQRRTLDQAQRDLGVPLAAAVRALIADLRTRIERRGLASPDAAPTAVRDLTLNRRLLDQARQLVESHLVTTYERSAQQSRSELIAGHAQFSAHFATRPGLTGAKALRFFKAKAFWITDLIAEAILGKAKAVLFNALKGDKLLRTVLVELDDILNEWLPTFNRGGQEVNVPARIETIARTNLAEAWASARMATFTDPDLPDGFIQGLLYSAILDDRVRDTHAAWDGIVKAPAWWLGPPDRNPPNGYNCRCSLIPVFPADGYPVTPDTALPTAVIPDPGFK
jgi:hypothetical protein